MSETINNISIHYHLLILHGNYNVNTFIKQFITSLAFYSSNFELTFNPITGKFYLKNNVSNQFIIHATSTIGPVMGFIEGVELGSSYVIYISDYPCNFNGINSFNILIENIINFYNSYITIYHCDIFFQFVPNLHPSKQIFSSILQTYCLVIVV